MFQEFRNTPTPLLVIKFVLVFVTITLFVLSIFLNRELLSYGMISTGLFIFIYGIERKISAQEDQIFLLSIIVAVIFFAIAGYISTNPFV